MRPSLVRFAPAQGGGQGLVSTSKLPEMEAIPLQSGAVVTMTAPPPSSSGKEVEIAAPECSGGGAHGSPAWSKLEDDEGAAPVSRIVGIEPGGEKA
jgi:hypothetical protein